MFQLGNMYLLYLLRSLAFFAVESSAKRESLFVGSMEHPEDFNQTVQV